MAGKVCLGFVFARGRAGFEAFDDNESLGLFPEKTAAISALSDRFKKNASSEPAKRYCDDARSHGDLPPMQQTFSA
jgi:hypothetical protein